MEATAPSSVPGIVISSNPSLHAYTTTSSTKTSFTITNPSPALTNLLAKAPPSLSFSDHIHYPTNPRGRPRTAPAQGKKRFKAGIYLDDLPANVPRPQLVQAAASPAAAPSRGRNRGRLAKKGATAKEEKMIRKTRKTKAATATAKTAAPPPPPAPSQEVTQATSPAVGPATVPTTEPTSKKSAEAAATATEKTTDKEKENTAKKPAAAPSRETNTELAISTAAQLVRPKGLEIDMLPGTFLAEGEGRGSRPRKRPARFEDTAEVETKKSKKSKMG
ncbi:MAG: hypothetical protein Q9201_004700 [Fulgogasparrea decipioides]